MGIAAVTGMMLSAIGVWLVFTTFRETRKATVIATDSLEAVIDSERAKICMADSALVGKAPNEPHKLAISIVLNNIGKSNATVRLIYWSAARDANWPETFDHIRDVSLAAPEKGNLKIDYLRYHIAVPETHFVSGTVVYETILGRTFKTHFSYRVSQPFAESGAPLSVWYANYRRWPGQPDDT